MDKNVPSVRIPCNKVVKEYTTANIKQLVYGCTLSELYEKLVSGEAVKTRRNVAALNLLQDLLGQIEGFAPPVPVSNSDHKRIKQFLDKWKDKVTLLESQINALSTSPIYLRDKVNEVLKQKKSKVQCTNLHLEWYLLTYGAAEMMPDRIASVMMLHSETIETQIKAPRNNDNYYPRLVENSDSSRKQFRSVVEFIYDFPCSVDIDALTGKLTNDLEVVAELQTWHKEKPKDYEYVMRYQELVDKLQTAPSFKLRKQTSTGATTATIDAASGGQERNEETEKDDNASIITHDDAKKIR